MLFPDVANINSPALAPFLKAEIPKKSSRDLPTKAQMAEYLLSSCFAGMAKAQL